MLGDDRAVAVSEVVTGAAERDGLEAGEGVAVMLVGAVHETSVSASNRRSIVGR